MSYESYEASIRALSAIIGQKDKTLNMDKRVDFCV